MLKKIRIVKIIISFFGIKISRTIYTALENSKQLNKIYELCF